MLYNTWGVITPKYKLIVIIMSQVLCSFVFSSFRAQRSRTVSLQRLQNTTAEARSQEPGASGARLGGSGGRPRATPPRPAPRKGRTANQATSARKAPPPGFSPVIQVRAKLPSNRCARRGPRPGWGRPGHTTRRGGRRRNLRPRLRVSRDSAPTATLAPGGHRPRPEGLFPERFPDSE